MSSAQPGYGWHNYLLTQAERTPEAPAMIGPAETLTFRQLAWRVRRYAGALASAGVKRGDVAVVRMPREYDLVTTLALSMLGAISASNTAKQYYEFEPITNWLITRKPVENYPEAKQIVTTPAWIQRAFNNTDPFDDAGFTSAEDLMRLVFTSGTTGRPKAVQFTCQLIDDRFTITDTTHPNRGVALTLFDMGAVGGSSRAVGELRLGNPYLHFGEKRDPRDIVALSHKVPIVRLHGSPGQLDAFLNAFEASPFDFSHLKEIHSGGASVPISLQRRILNRHNVLLKVRYGSTEGGNVAWRAADPDLPQGFVGKINPHVELQIVDAGGARLPDGEQGQVRYRSKYVTSGYYQNPEANAKAFKDGWFYPGDLGWVIDGALYIGGRETEVINLNGQKFDPALLDEVAIASGGFSGAAAFGYQDHRERSQLGFGVVADPSLNRKTAEKAVLKTLAKNYKINSDVLFIYLDQIPRGDNGKILRRELTEQAERKRR